MLNFLEIMSIFIALDILTGWIGAIATKSFSSSKMREGLYHKLAFYGAFALSVAMEFASGQLDLGVSIPATGAVTGYVILTEVVSILENLCTINPDLKNKKFLEMFGKSSD